MKQWLTLLIGLTIGLVGCAADPVQLPNFEEAERSEEIVTDPTDYPALCEIPDWDVDCWQIFVAYEEVAENNRELAQINADIARDSDTAYDYILSAAKRQQQVGQIREEMLEAERRDHFIDNLWHRGVIALLALGLIL